MSKFIDLTGRKFSRLTVMGRAENSKVRMAQWQCKCECGSVCVVGTALLKTGKTRSCGCLAIETRRRLMTTHGKSETREYNVWMVMRQRCKNPNNPEYHNYGARGIKICSRWRDFQNFYDDMGVCAKGLSIERRDNDGPYSPENCYWATLDDQLNNTRRTVFLTLAGVRCALAKWARALGVPRGTLYSAYYKRKLDKYDALAATI